MRFFTAFLRFFGIAQQVVNNLPQLRRIAPNVGQIRRQHRLDGDVRSFIQPEHFANQPIEVERGQFGCRHPGIVGEFIDHALHGLHLVDDHLRRPVKHFRIATRQLLGQLELQAFGRKLNRRQRILDLMRQPPGNFAPGGTTLRRNQTRHVIENYQVTACGSFGQLGTAQ